MPRRSKVDYMERRLHAHVFASELHHHYSFYNTWQRKRFCVNSDQKHQENSKDQAPAEHVLSSL